MPSEIYTGMPNLIVDRGSCTLGWQGWPKWKGGPGYVLVRRGANGALKVMERYPMTDDGWAQAWRALVRLDPVTAEEVAVALDRRADPAKYRALAAKSLEERRELEASTLASLSAALFIGGYLPGAELRAGEKYTLLFLKDRLAVNLPYASRALVELRYAEVQEVEVGGPGLVKTGGGAVGGGFGLAGAAEGIAIAALLNALTTRTTIKTVLRIQSDTGEMFFLDTTTVPEQLRIQLSGPLSAIREARRAAATTGQKLGTTGTASSADELSKLASLLDSGLLTREEFDTLKARLIART